LFVFTEKEKICEPDMPWLISPSQVLKRLLVAKLDELARPNTFTIGSVIYKGKIADYLTAQRLPKEYQNFSSDFSLIVDFHLVQLLLIFFRK
jgi:hypothetical protein